MNALNVLTKKKIFRIQLFPVCKNGRAHLYGKMSVCLK